MSEADDRQDQRVRAAVYDGTIRSGRPPLVAILAGETGLDEAEVRESLERLAAGRALVLQPVSREVLMANPFSAVPSPFAVTAGDRLYFGNCIWDALGIAAMLDRDSTIDASCGCCGEAMGVQVRGGVLQPVEAVVHFAIPAHQWWRDIVYN
jgi:mercuric reductase